MKDEIQFFAIMMGAMIVLAILFWIGPALVPERRPTGPTISTIAEKNEDLHTQMEVLKIRMRRLEAEFKSFKKHSIAGALMRAEEYGKRKEDLKR